MDQEKKLEELMTEALETAKMALKEAERANSYFEIQKVWSAHAYCYRAQQQRYELEHYWSREHDDIMYAHDTMAFVGRDTVTEYYAKGNEIMNAGKLKLAAELFPGKIEDEPENLGVGDLVVRLQATPYIEIAGDGMTAKGIWYVLGYNVEMDRQGEPDVCLLLSKECVDFVKEADGWKIWHFRDCGDFMGQVNDTFLKSILYSMHPESGADGEHKGGGRTVDGAFPAPNRVIYSFGEQGGYNVLKPAKFAPELPQPYDTWDESMSYAREAE